MVQWKGSTGTCPFSLRTSKEARLFPGFFACRKSQFSIQKVFGRLFEKGGRVEGRRPSSPSAEGESPDSSKDQEGRCNSPVGCCVVGNPIKGFPDAAYHAAFGQPAICQPVFRHADTPAHWCAGVFFVFRDGIGTMCCRLIGRHMRRGLAANGIVHPLHECARPPPFGQSPKRGQKCFLCYLRRPRRINPPAIRRVRQAAV